MVHLFDVNEENWIDIIKLSVNEEQQKYLDRPTGIIARGYIYRNCNGRVFGIADDSQIIGVALVRDFTEEPFNYDLQQFMIDRRFQNKGYGTEALRLILDFLKRDGRYNGVEVCVNRKDTMALHVYEKVGFVDSGYIDEDLPHCLNLIYHL
ncbi:MAG: GNAT family N-acetyltransferase [Lachnospiraceae bacterium]|nr:GNAT family N-acetyltransferase [Lachnospiraceae bacterium]MBQ9123144.1 GNAT family N-acetyltransferase [Lachnospiraceae bacterium]